MSSYGVPCQHHMHQQKQEYLFFILGNTPRGITSCISQFGGLQSITITALISTRQIPIRARLPRSRGLSRMANVLALQLNRHEGFDFVIKRPSLVLELFSIGMGLAVCLPHVFGLWSDAGTRFLIPVESRGIKECLDNAILLPDLPNRCVNIRNQKSERMNSHHYSTLTCMNCLSWGHPPNVFH